MYSSKGFETAYRFELSALRADRCWMLDSGCIKPVSIFIQHQVSSIILLYIACPMPLKSLGKKGNSYTIKL